MNVVSTVVSYAHPGNIEAVFIAGAVQKWRGTLVGHDVASIRRKAHQSRDNLFAQRGTKVGILG